MRRRPWIKIVFVLFAGIVLNVAVAWVCAHWGSGFPRALNTTTQAVSTVPDEANAFINDPTYLKAFGSGRKTGQEKETLRALLCTRVQYVRWHDHRILYSRSYIESEFGLPFRSLYVAELSSWNMAAFPENATWRASGLAGGLILTSRDRNFDRQFGYDPPGYPVLPLPWGFLANTLIYAALVFALLALVTRIIGRDRRRLRRGVCPQCAYPMGGSTVCTECGRPLPARP